MAIPWQSGRLQAGKLRHRIDLVLVSPEQDSTGGVNLNVDIIYANVWASVEALAGTETLSAEAQTGVVTHQIIIRFIGAAPSWQAANTYVGGALVKDSNGYLQQASPGGGISGSTAPSWSQIVGNPTTDGNFTWKNVGMAALYTGVTSAMQVWFQGRQFQITAVLNPDERNKMLCLKCVEINDSRQQIPALAQASSSSLLLSDGTYLILSDSESTLGIDQ
jgi:head-tail adaptor